MSGPSLSHGFPLEPITIDRAAAPAGLDALRNLLDTGQMDERRDILPLFRAHPHLGALLALVYFFDLAQARPAIGREVRLGFFSADLVVADLHRNHYLLVEFEHGHYDSIFARGARRTRTWHRTFEHGYSQIVDWFWWLANNRGASDYRRLFPREEPLITGLLVIGRDLPAHETELHQRLARRIGKTVIDSNKVYISTYDELYRALDSNSRAF